MANALRELLALFEIGVEDKELEEANHKLEGFVGRIKKVGEVVAEVFAVNLLKEFFGEQIEAAERLTVLAARTGLATDALQKFQFAANLVGVDSEQAAHSLGFLNRSVGEALTGGKEQAEAFSRLHVSLKETDGAARPVGDVLNDVADAISKLPDQQTKAAYAMKLFGREGQVLLPLLSKGRDGLAEVSAEFDELGGGLSKEYVEAATKAAEETKRLGLAWTSLKARITSAALPAIERVIGVLKNGVKGIIEFADHTKLLEHGMTLLAAVAGYKLTLSLIKMARTFGLLKPSILETVASMLGFALPLALAAAIVMAVEDLWTALEGGDSVIGDFLTNLYGTEKAKAILDDLRGSFEALKPVWETLKELGPVVLKGMIESIPVLARAFLGLTETVKAFFDSFMGVASALKELGLAFTEKDLGGVLKRFQSAGKDLSDSGNKTLKDIDVAGDTLVDRNGFFGKLINGGSTNLADYGVPLTTPGAPVNLPAPAAIGGSAPGASMQQHNEISVHVSAAENPRATGEAVGAGVATKLERVNYNGQQALQRR